MHYELLLIFRQQQIIKFQKTGLLKQLFHEAVQKQKVIINIYGISLMEKTLLDLLLM